MKKILSLVLAVLMLASLAISASAISIPFKNDCKDDVLQSLIEYHKWYYLEGCIPGDFEPLTDTWYDECPGCKGLAEYFTYDNSIVWYCLGKCGGVGSTPIVTTTPVQHIKPAYVKANCPTCNSSSNTFYVATGIVNGTVKHSFFCAGCKYSFYTDAKVSTLPNCGACHKPTCNICHNYYYCIFCSPCCGGTTNGTTHVYFEDFTGKCPDCKGVQSFQFYYTHGGVEYGFYKCANGHAHAYPKKSAVVIKPAYRCYFCGDKTCLGECIFGFKPGFDPSCKPDCDDCIVAGPTYDCAHCDKSANYQFTYTQLGVTYAYYKCANGHAYSVAIHDGCVINPGYACKICGKYNCDGYCNIDPGFSYPDYSLPGIKEHYKCTECDQTVDYLFYFNVDGTLYGHYECENGHVAAYPLYPGISSTPTWGDYCSVTVIANIGGASNATGKYYAKLGEYKKFDFTPKAGYVLSAITVNGKSVEISDILNIKITGNTVIRAFYTPVSTVEKYAITAQTDGNGTITATKNGVAVNSTAIKLSTADTIVYKFVPKTENYVVADVKIDGVSIGSTSTYTFRGVTANHVISVDFAWKSPYNYIAPGYERAVEYVTETGIMSPLGYDKSKPYFGGTNMVSVKTFAMALAEMADVRDLLNTDAQRESWAKQIGLILATDKVDQPCSVQTACRIIDTYLEYVQKASGVDFILFNSEADAKANGISIGLVTEKGYETNRTLTRYDLASVCYLIKNLGYSVNG